MTREQAIAAFIAEARWFGGKGRAFEIAEIRDVALADDVSTTLVTLTFEDATSNGSTSNGSTSNGGAAGEVYQVPISSYDEPEDRLHHALIGEWDDQLHYDAVHDREAMAGWLRAFAAATPTAPNGAFHRSGEHEFDLEAHSTLFSGEQSNSSVAFGEDSLMKVFRRVTSGVNPDIEIHEALTRAGSTHVAALYGHVDVVVEEGELHLAMLQQFLRTASDGWDLALASVRNLFAEGDLHADEVGGDFAAEAHRLGAAVAEIHLLLATEFPTVPFDPAATAKTMRDRLTAAQDVVPELTGHQESLVAMFDAIKHVGHQSAQRIHGDLHLGQTLRTSLGWKLVDFEGEPAKGLAERQLPDSRWRDIAGMLRSFDYAASTVARDLDAIDEDEAGQIAYRAQEWVERNASAFLAGYVEQRDAPLTSDELTLVTAYLADKAVYETVYEARNRPAWQAIPLGALHRLTEGVTEYTTTES
jgi:maltokinase